ncbi:MAG: ATP-binding cassette domain-containing protein [Burkholderiaceae bacterium]
MGSPVVASLALAGVLFTVPALAGDFIAFQLGLFLLYGMACQGVGLAWGRGGFLPLGQALFFGLGAYLGGGLLASQSQASPWFWLLFALVVPAIAALAFGLAWLVFRGRSDSGPAFSLITLALAMLGEQVAGSVPALTGGFNGLGGIAPLAGLDPYGAYYYLVVVVVAAVTGALLWLDRRPAGLLMRAVADNERRLQFLGFATPVVKAAIFALSAGLAALAGLLYAPQQGIVTPVSIGFLLSAEFVIWTAVGGRFSVIGPLLGAVTIGLLSAQLRDSFAYWEVLLAGVFLVVVLRAPGGIVGILGALLRRVRGEPPVSPHDLAMRSWFAPSATAPAGNGSPAEAAGLLPASAASGVAQALQYEAVHLRIGTVRILQGLDWQTPSQGVVFMIGPNGAGKTTVLNATTGALPIQAGRILLGDRPLHRLGPDRLLAAGLARKFQIPTVFSGLSVADNLRLAGFAARLRIGHLLSAHPLRWRQPFLARLMATPGMTLRADDLARPARELPQGHRQVLELLMACAAQPRVLLLDEPCAGLSAEETGLVVRLVERVRDELQGLVIVIEHDMSLVERLADRVVVLHQGRMLASGTLAQVRTDPAVTAVYAGGHK